MTESDFSVPLRVERLMRGFRPPWAIAGGWAIDLYLGRVTRRHKDVEIAIFRGDQCKLHAHLSPGFDLRLVRNGRAGQPTRREPWSVAHRLESSIHQLEAIDRLDGFVLEILIDERDNGNWRFRRNMRICMPLESAIKTSEVAAVPHIAPEIALLFKAKKPRAEDEADFRQVLQILPTQSRDWLKAAVSQCHPGHGWSHLLGGPNRSS
jgi:Aminoglycoside-2''-adenylyltransferase